MEMHSGYNGCEDFVAHKIMDVLLQQTVSTLEQSMMFMSDKAQDALLGRLFTHKEMLQKARQPDNTGGNNI
jgi:hypothetical protein